MDDDLKFGEDRGRSFSDLVPLFRLRRTPARVPLLRLVRQVGPGDVEHLYTASRLECDAATEHHGYALKDVVCAITDLPVTGSVPLVRLWHVEFRRHSLTAHPANLAAAHARRMYIREGVAGHVFLTDGQPGTVPLYALVHRARYAHLYTTDEAERDAAVAAGAEALGIACWVYPAEAQPEDKEGDRG